MAEYRVYFKQIDAGYIDVVADNCIVATAEAILQREIEAVPEVERVQLWNTYPSEKG